MKRIFKQDEIFKSFLIYRKMHGSAQRHFVNWNFALINRVEISLHSATDDAEAANRARRCVIEGSARPPRVKEFWRFET
ncbi:hypothetical protein [Mesorhizobium sp.]|uniref:hypothetical protein n=1 Tax=Mesorhizobium sp. TaxID=1871066 RepID=UPI000FE2A264|nr:hypothetical protein [Mesorhizobium sp.]RWH72442.1 MAG: hypothetical protein EOQ84_09315 [Mesorhizobium sp.]RWL34674.1 MAG: hypothetical protein EOR58_02690 [Mesorhizobium sp.]RWL36087.1 MAG: hypothetical protein EOR63_05270 [Mesorhizobium sp.]RWL41498.1 MAG: hypothetical protein EOR59_02695 [Mesorhizobium sp.]RWL45109.1 MAG: hypothetical protein EOR61_29180 [Mesorhizobium sp.]